MGFVDREIVALSGGASCYITNVLAHATAPHYLSLSYLERLCVGSVSHAHIAYPNSCHNPPPTHTHTHPKSTKQRKQRKRNNENSARAGPRAPGPLGLRRRLDQGAPRLRQHVRRFFCRCFFVIFVFGCFFVALCGCEGEKTGRGGMCCVSSTKGGSRHRPPFPTRLPPHTDQLTHPLTTTTDQHQQINDTTATSRSWWPRRRTLPSSSSPPTSASSTCVSYVCTCE